VSERLRWARRGVRGGVRGQPPEIFFLGRHIFFSGRHIFAGPTYFGPTYFRDHMILGGFRHMVFADGFLFPVKELGFWTNPGHWVRVLDAAGSYMYIVL
jgi:hypothetical protein